MTNCPNCGAVITGPKCEYCDTIFDIKCTGYTSTIEAVKELEKYNNLLRQQIVVKEMYDSAIRTVQKIREKL